MDYKSKEAIDRSFRMFDINSPSSDREADIEIMARTGDLEVSDPSDLNGNGTEQLSLTKSIGVATFAQGEHFQSLLKIATDAMDEWVIKSENLKESQDYRTAHSTMALAAKKILTAFGEYVIQHQQRLLETSTDERALMDTNTQLLLSRLAEPPAPVVTDNRADLVDSLVPKFAKEQITPEENARRSRDFIRQLETIKVKP
jgi:hypothetical protein